MRAGRYEVPGTDRGVPRSLACPSCVPFSALTQGYSNSARVIAPGLVFLFSVSKLKLMLWLSTPGGSVSESVGGCCLCLCLTYPLAPAGVRIRNRSRSRKEKRERSYMQYGVHEYEYEYVSAYKSQIRYGKWESLFVLGSFYG